MTKSRRVGFDFAIEYRRRDVRRACRTVGDDISVVLRDRLVRTPGTRGYLYDAC